MPFIKLLNMEEGAVLGLGGGWDGEDDEVYWHMVSLEALGAGAIFGGDRSLMQAEFLAGLRIVSK